MRTLYSITLGSLLTIINPIKINPLYGSRSFFRPLIVGLIIRDSIFDNKASSTKGTGDIAPIPPVFKPVSPSPILL